MTPKLAVPHFSLSLAPIAQHPLLLLALVLLILMVLSSLWRTARVLFALVLVGSVGYGLVALAQYINQALHSSKGHSSWIVMPTLNGKNQPLALPVLQVHGINAGAMAVLLILAVAGLIFFGAVKSSGYSIGYVLNRLWGFFTRPIYRGGRGDVYSFSNVTLGVGIGQAEPGLPEASQGAGKRVILEAKDRFLNMGIIGPIGSGKTFMTMKPMIFQDLEALAQGTMANLVWVSPQPEPSVEKYAESLGLTVRRIHIIDGQVDGKQTNVRFNPLSGNDIDAIISNVNIVLNEQTGDKGKGDAFFDTMAAQATTDSLQLYKYLHGFDAKGIPVEIDMIGWYDNYLVRMDELFYEASRVQLVSELVTRNQVDASLPDARSNWILHVVWPKLSQAERTMLERAAASIINEFGGDVSGKNADAYKNIIRGLRGKVRVLISSQYVQELLGSDVPHVKDRPNFSFESWIDPKEWIAPKVENPFASHGGWFSKWNSKLKYKKYVREHMEAWKKEAPHGRNGELLSVITGQTEIGKLVGRMVLVFLQQAVLNRPGKDNDKPPVYTYVDEYPSYATRSINEIRTQGRKHCHCMVMAMQSRAQMEEVGRGYLRIMEGSTRHWVYLSNLGAEDAMDVSKLCGKVKRIRTSQSARQIRMGGLGKDDGGPLVTKSQQEELVERFSPHFIRYELTENEVIYIGVKNRRGQKPLRMRIHEPQENKALIRKVAASMDPPKPKKPIRPIPVYPNQELVAKVKWPILTWGHQTLYIYRWGLSFGRDVYGPKKKVDLNESVVDVEPKLLKDVFGEKFFHATAQETTSPTPDSDESPSEDETIEQRRQRLKILWNKKKAEKEQESGSSDTDTVEKQESSSEPSVMYCVNDGNEMNAHVLKDGTLLYKCSLCQGTKGISYQPSKNLV
ncbi:TraM recognition domain-containing protein [Alicyclobacillus tolerans]|uniref:TraM recognition domain-containing protein n=1 Tax=Alicyclobacillus tolerans TaxID=90970 RepID=UPI001F16EB22|nr:TraM recognition domain-containing protein [Alicyclobacillus tolerans]MCF8567444.1 TraM recognition domain-containing protein [Alicyclobacillus tolerans]